MCCKNENSYVVYLSPKGKLLNQSIVNDLSKKEHIIMLSGHYEGIDNRIVENYVDEEISIGDYVLTGGELAACVFADSVIRLLPGVLNDEQSAMTDSFQDNLLSPPIYTRPETYKGLSVPKILLSGNTSAIEDWLHDEAVRVTKERRPDLLE
jgi:tRNA (guanine37-N1)-methyltransferase